MRLHFKKFKTIDGKLEGHFVSWAPTPLHNSLEEKLGSKGENSERWDLSGSNVNPGEIVVNLYDESLFQYEQQIRDLVKEHGSQEAVDARAKAEAERMPPRVIDGAKISEATWQQHRTAMEFEVTAKANNNGEMIEVLFAHIRVLQAIIFGRST